MGEVSFAVRDDFQNQYIATDMLSYLTEIALSDNMEGFTAEVLVENKPMLRVFEKMGFDIEKKVDDGVYELLMKFGEWKDEKKY
jgi:RimJ/RimL family protein N-acetyltransferase